MNDILGFQEDFLWGDREAINYKNASAISFKNLFPNPENRVPSCPFHKSDERVPPEGP